MKLHFQCTEISINKNQMNNDNVVGLPAVPDQVNEWAFYRELHDCRQEFGRNNATRGSYRLQRRVLLRQLKLMSDTVCLACGGRAHRARDCPTNLRLGMLSASNVEFQKLIAWTRSRVALADR